MSSSTTGPGAPIAASSTQAKFNTFAIVAIIGAFVVPLIGAAFGIVAVRQIAKTGERGRGLALAGVVIGILFTIIYIVTFVTSLSLTMSVSGY